MTDPLFMLEIEQKMYADTSGAFRKGMLDRLRMLRGALELRRRQLNDPETFLRIQAAIQAVEAAIDVLGVIRVGRGKHAAHRRAGR
ncbi:MAG: EscE/YscE/SsaE family type III secretion system needle protein co-chaperone [Noviherbaspirillum sp.]